MMSQPFTGTRRFCRPTTTRPEDFLMTNNNYLPGISRMNCNFNSVQNNVIPQTQLSCNEGCSNSMEQGSSVNVNTLNEQCDVIDKTSDSDSLMTCDPSSIVTTTNVTINPQTWPTSKYDSAAQIPSTTVSFTFTTPTQCYLYSPSLTATSQNRFHYTRATPQNFAPGCNAQWKHTVPRQIPWRCQNVVSTNQGFSVFTGSQSSNVNSMISSENVLGTNTFYSLPVNDPVASCSEVKRRQKRRHTVDSMDENNSQTKIHLTEERIAKHLKELNINQFSPPPSDSERNEMKLSDPMCSNFINNVNSATNTATGCGITGQRKLKCSNSGLIRSESFKPTLKCGCDITQSICVHSKHFDIQSKCQTQSDNAEFLRHSQRQWHDFKLLEEKLEMIDEDSDLEEKTSTLPKLKITEGINITPTPSIPHDIMEKIRNPCREVILWSPPEPGIKKPVGIDSSHCHDNILLQPCMDTMESCVTVNSEPSYTEKIIEDSNGMDTDAMDDMLEL
ncbi:hypothetical protein ACF0H5_016705 [Mactra antiquata]